MCEILSLVLPKVKQYQPYIKTAHILLFIHKLVIKKNISLQMLWLVWLTAHARMCRKCSQTDNQLRDQQPNSHRQNSRDWQQQVNIANAGSFIWLYVSKRGVIILEICAHGTARPASPWSRRVTLMVRVCASNASYQIHSPDCQSYGLDHVHTHRIITVMH